MKIEIFGWSAGALLLAVSPLAWGQADAGSTNSLPSSFQIQDPEKPLLNKLTLSYRMGINITVDFKKLGGFARQSDPGPASGAYNRTYDNTSYVKIDSSTNAGGLTWNWGYQNAEQLQNGGLVMQSSTSPNDATSKNHENDPQTGVELGYSRELFRDAENWKVGIEAALGYTHVAVSDSRRILNHINQITDTYSIPPGVVVPLPPYNGTFEGPGALIGSEPSDRTTTVVSSEALITGDRTVDSDVFMLRLGPYMEVPIYKKLSFIFDGGLLLGVGFTDLHYRESVTIEGSGTVSRSSSGSQNDFLLGGYVGGVASYALTERISLLAGVQFEAAGSSVANSKVRLGDPATRKQSVLNLGEALLVNVGVSYSF
jgi:hypothetical protein